MSGGKITRRVLLGTAGAGFVVAGTKLLEQPPKIIHLPAAGSSQPRVGGRIRVAGTSSSTADTLDPVKGALGTDYVRHFMLYSGLTELDRDLNPYPAFYPVPLGGFMGYTFAEHVWWDA